MKKSTPTPEKPRPRKPARAPVLLHPIHGCAPIGTLSEQQVEARMRELREMVRMYWDQPSVKAVVELAELRTARLTRNALEPDATDHERGQAYGLSKFLEMMAQIRLSVEEG